jgi:hypothetical protein
MKRIKFYNTYNSTWTITPLVLIDYEEEEELCLAIHWLCWGIVIILKSYENKNGTSE